ncbi:MAG: ECF-type sigma factor [Planctomycetota bacterium]|jgi:RNA polymerase sigma factor (TIGR02999 family)
MSSPGKSEVTRILSALDRDEPGAAAKLLPMVYEELRKLAHARMRHEPANLTLEPTALVHEAYLRLLGDEEVRWNNRGHFFGAAAEAMRRILVERARKYRQPKYGGDRKRVALDPAASGLDESSDDVLEIDEALRKLESQAGPQADVVKLRYFAGLTIDQTAEVLGLSAATVDRRWSFARAWLFEEIERSRNPESGRSGEGSVGRPSH